MNRTIATLGAAALLAAASLAGLRELTREAPAPGQILAYRDVEVVARGETLYADNCAACHGAGLEGAPDWQIPDADGYLPAPPHDPTGHTWHHPDAQLIQITTLGTEAVVGGGYRSRMPGFGDVLSPEEIVAILSYIKSTWPRHIVETHDEINRRNASD